MKKPAHLAMCGLNPASQGARPGEQNYLATD